jgi:hypothetical protein
MDEEVRVAGRTWKYTRECLLASCSQAHAERALGASRHLVDPVRSKNFPLFMVIGPKRSSIAAWCLRRDMLPWVGPVSSVRLDTGLRHRLESSQRSLRVKRRQFDSSRLVLQPRVSFRYLIHHGQHRVLQSSYRAERHALANADDRERADQRTERKPMVMGRSYGCGNGARHRRDTSVPIYGLYRTMKQVFTFRGTVHGGEEMMDIWEHLAGFKGQRCDRHNEAA